MHGTTNIKYTEPTKRHINIRSALTWRYQFVAMVLITYVQLVK